MKSFIALLTALLITALTAANHSVTSIDKNEIAILENFDVEGSWAGILKISSAKLRIVFNVSRDSSGNLTANLDSPDQGAYGIEVSQVILNEDSVKFIVGVINGFYAGKFDADSLKIFGLWNQGGMSLPLELAKSEKVEKPKRPQEPKEPFPYSSEEVKFINPETGDTLAGTLTLPNEERKLSVVILVSGSGPQNRDEELHGHKPFLVLSDYLTRNGIAVLRYDDRGIGKSTGNFRSATSEDFANGLSSVIDSENDGSVTRRAVTRFQVPTHSVRVLTSGPVVAAPVAEVQ